MEGLVVQLEAAVASAGAQIAAADLLPYHLAIPLARSAGRFSRRGAELCERILLAYLPRSAGDQRLDQYPPTALYNLVLLAWGNTRSALGAARAQHVFDVLMPSDLQDRKSHKSLLRAWAVSGAQDGPTRAHQVLRDMERLGGVSHLLDLREGEGGDAKTEEEACAREGARTSSPSYSDRGLPDRSVYNAVLAAYSKSSLANHQHGLSIILDLADRLKRLHQITNSWEHRPDQFTFDAVLRAYQRFLAATVPRRPVEPAVASRIEDVVRQLLTLGRGTEAVSVPCLCGVAVEAWLQTEPPVEGATRAHNLVLALAGRQALLPDLPPLPPGTYPDQSSIAAVIQAWDRLSVEGSRHKVDELVDVAVEAPFPRIYFANAAVEFWSRSDWHYSADLVERILERCWERTAENVRMKPTGQTFVIAIRAWLRNKRDEAPHRAELLFQQMQRLYAGSGDRYFRPRDEHLRFVLTCWLSRCEDGKRYHGLAGYKYPAEHIENHLRTVAKHDWVKNIPGHYSMAIRAWALQSLPQDGPNISPIQRSVGLLDELSEKVGTIPSFPVNWCLDLCSRQQSTLEKRKEAYDAAIATFRRGERSARTFILMTDVFKTHVTPLDDNHLAIMEELFLECCDCGLLTQDMIWHMVEVLSADALQRLFGVSYEQAAFIVKVRATELDSTRMSWSGVAPSELQLKNLPQEWSRKAYTQRKANGVESGPL